MKFCQFNFIWQKWHVSDTTPLCCQQKKAINQVSSSKKEVASSFVSDSQLSNTSSPRRNLKTEVSLCKRIRCGPRYVVVWTGTRLLFAQSEGGRAFRKEGNVCYENAPIALIWKLLFFPDIGLNSIKYAIRLMEGTWNPERIFLSASTPEKR